MGLSFRKSIRLGKHVRINLSQHGGIGLSAGVKGFRISKNAKGLRFTIGGKGIHYTKWFTKKKKRKAKKDNQDENIKKLTTEAEIQEEIINPETDFERIPTEDEKALLLYLGSKERNYLLYFLLTTFVGLAIYSYFSKELYAYIGAGLNFVLFGYYLFISKLNKYIMNMNRSIHLFNKNRFDKAYKLLSDSVKIKPNSEKALMMLMFTTFKLEKYDETLNYIEQYDKDNELLEVMYFMKAFACSELGKYHEGIKSIEKVYSDEEDIKYAKYKILGDCYLGLNEIDRAINWYEELPVRTKEMNEDILEYKYALGKALALKGDKKRAFTYLSKVYDYQADYQDVKALLDEIHS